jgi:hypothetical protein
VSVKERLAHSRWSPLLPWTVLPLALAIITVVDRLRGRRRPSRREIR